MGSDPAAAGVPADQVPTFQLRARVVSVGGQPSAGQSFNVSFPYYFNAQSQQATGAGSNWSNWLKFDRPQVDITLGRYPNSSPSTMTVDVPVVLYLHFDGVVDPTQVEAQVTLDGTGSTVTLSGELFGPTLGVLVWRDQSNVPHVGTMADYNQRYWTALNGVDVPVAQRPKLFPIVDRFIGGDDDRRDWRDGIDNLSKAGCSVLMVPPSRPIRDLILETGRRRTAWAVYNPPGYYHDFADGPTVTQADLDAWARQQAQPFLDAGYAPTDMALFAMSDEPGWYYPKWFQLLTSHPDALARFRTYLSAQKLQPADVGAGSWDQVMPIGRSQATDLPSRRLFYWTMRFFSADSSQHFANATRSLEKAFYPNLPVYANWNNFNGRFYVPGPILSNPDKQSPDAAMGAHDWFEFGRLRGGTMMWTEDWFADSNAYFWSFYSAKLRSAAAKSGGQFGGYVVPATTGGTSGGLLQKVLCLVGNGAKAIEYFVFGPEYNFPNNCYSENLGALPKMAEAHRMIGAAEDVLWPGKRPAAQIAILVPRSAEAWDEKDAPSPTQILDAANPNVNFQSVDYMVEVAGLYLALQHQNIPVDFVDEDDLSLPGLKPYRVLYITEPNIPAEGQRGIAEWVRAGGTLVTTKGAGERDRYDDPSTVLTELAGIPEQASQPLLVDNAYVVDPVSGGQGALGAFTAYGSRSLNPPPDQRLTAPLTAAQFQDGSSAVMSRRVRRGRVVLYSWMPGLSYVRSSTSLPGPLPYGFSASIRQWIVYPTTLANIVPPVTVDPPLVEAPLLVSSAGAAVTMLNWTGASLANVKLNIRVPFTVQSVQSVKRGPLTFQQTKNGVTCSLPLDAADIITLHP